MRKAFVAAAAIVFAGAGCSLAGNAPAVPAPKSAMPFSYSLDAAIGQSTKTEIFPAPAYDEATLRTLMDECGTKYTDAHVKQVASAFSNAQMTQYAFEYNGASQQGPFLVSVVPNAPGYKTIEEAKKDLDACYAGGDAYPVQVSAKWILYINGCGTGYADDSGRPFGCQEVKDAMESSLKLKE